MKSLTVCITYDDNFEPMCAHLCSNLRVEGLKIRLNKTESKDDYRAGFRSKNWYMNLSEKMLFLRKRLDLVEYGEILCVCDADIQFFKPLELLRIASMMQRSELEYVGQRERDEDMFNGGFFFIKKNQKTLEMVDAVNSEDLTKYKHAEQDVINRLVPSMGIKHHYLSRAKYLNGCMRFNSYVCPKMSRSAVMHHATCAYDAGQKMRQMNFVREKLGIPPIDWRVYVGI